MVFKEEEKGKKMYTINYVVDAIVKIYEVFEFDIGNEER